MRTGFFCLLIFLSHFQPRCASGEIRVALTGDTGTALGSGDSLAEAVAQAKMEPGSIKTLSISGNTPLTDEDMAYIKLYIANETKNILSVDLGAASFMNDKLPDNAFDNDITGAAGNLDNLAEVILPHTLRAIGEGAFYACGSLRSIEIPPSVTTVGEWAFAHSGIESIALPDAIGTIHDWTFYFCENLQRVALPGRLTSIGNTSFAFSGLRSIAIPDSVATIGNWAFRNASQLRALLISDALKLTANQDKISLHGTGDVVVFRRAPDEYSFWPEDLPEGGNGLKRVGVKTMPLLVLLPETVDLEMGGSRPLGTSLVYGNAEQLSNLRTVWLSDDPHIASVDEKGNIRAISSGRTTVRCIIHADATIAGDDESGSIVRARFEGIALTAAAAINVTAAGE